MERNRAKAEICFVERGFMAEIGRMLAWLGENCESYKVKLLTFGSVIGADEPVSIQIGFLDRCEASAFRARFAPPRAAPTVN